MTIIAFTRPVEHQLKIPPFDCNGIHQLLFYPPPEGDYMKWFLVDGWSKIATTGFLYVTVKLFLGYFFLPGISAHHWTLLLAIKCLLQGKCGSFLKIIEFLSPCTIQQTCLSFLFILPQDSWAENWLQDLSLWYIEGTFSHEIWHHRLLLTAINFRTLRIFNFYGFLLIKCWYILITFWSVLRIYMLHKSVVLYTYG